MRSRGRSISRACRNATPAPTCSAGAARSPTRRPSSLRCCTAPTAKARVTTTTATTSTRSYDALIDAARIESDPAKRKDEIAAAIAEHNAQIHHVPLHRQVIPWAMREDVRVVHRADNWIEANWVRIERRD